MFEVFSPKNKTNDFEINDPQNPFEVYVSAYSSNNCDKMWQETVSVEQINKGCWFRVQNSALELNCLFMLGQLHLSPDYLWLPHCFHCCFALSIHRLQWYSRVTPKHQLYGTACWFLMKEQTSLSIKFNDCTFCFTNRKYKPLWAFLSFHFFVSLLIAI